MLELDGEEELAVVKGIVALLDPSKSWENPEAATRDIDIGNYILSHTRFSDEFQLTFKRDYNVPWTTTISFNLGDSHFSWESEVLFNQELEDLYQRNMDKLLSLTL